MSALSFTVAYTAGSALPPARTVEHEKCFDSINDALDFCVRLSGLSCRPLCVIQRIRGIDDAVLEGDPLENEIARRRKPRLAAWPAQRSAAASSGLTVSP